jgi:geranylgeranylglycerol-phosphate geranylgeranyltransferase
MNSKKIIACIQLSRPVNVLITFVSIPVACWIAGGTAQDLLSIFLAALTGALVTVGANAINDSFDIEIDRINRPDRPLPLGILTQRDAQQLWLIVSLSAICINIIIHLSALLIVVFSIILLYYYSARLKKTVLVGNAVVAFMTGMAFIYGGAIVGHIERAYIPATFAFLVNFARELVKDVEDVEGDRKEHAATLPVRYGTKPALIGANLSLLALIVTTLLVIKYSVYYSAFTYIVIAADVLFCIAGVMMWQNTSSNHMRYVSSILKLSMIIGLIAIIAGSSGK